MEEETVKCRHCGYEAKFVTDDNGYYRAECTKCHSFNPRTGYRAFKWEARNDWNFENTRDYTGIPPYNSEDYPCTVANAHKRIDAIEEALIKFGIMHK